MKLYKIIKFEESTGDEGLDYFFANCGHCFKSYNEEVLMQYEDCLKIFEKNINNWKKICEYYKETEPSIRLRYHFSRYLFINKYYYPNLLESNAEIAFANYLIIYPNKFLKKIRERFLAFFRWLAWKTCLHFNTNYFRWVL